MQTLCSEIVQLQEVSWESICMHVRLCIIYSSFVLWEGCGDSLSISYQAYWSACRCFCETHLAVTSRSLIRISAWNHQVANPSQITEGMRLCSKNLYIKHLPGVLWNQADEGRMERQWLHITYKRDIWKKHIWKTSLLQIQGSRDPSIRNKLYDRSGSVAQGTRLPFYIPAQIPQNTHVWATDKALCKWSGRFMDQFSSQYSARWGTSHQQLPPSYHTSEQHQQLLKTLPVLYKEKKLRSWHLNMSDIYQRSVSTKTTLEFL